jgi:hypothetical protein
VQYCAVLFCCPSASCQCCHIITTLLLLLQLCPNWVLNIHKASAVLWGLHWVVCVLA